MNEAFIKICEIYINLHVFIKFQLRSIFNNDYFICLHHYIIEIYSKIEKIHMKNMKAAFIKLEIKI
jgi:hypothetical protein